MKYIAIAAFFILALIAGCESKISKPVFTASNFPVKYILEEITGENAEIYCPVKPGVSPHTFSPKPSDIYKIESSKAFFYVSETLDGWAESINTIKKVKLIAFIPDDLLLTFDESHEHHEGQEHENDKYANVDPHFWSDPLAVAAIVDKLVAVMSETDAGNSALYQSNGEKFKAKLKALHKEVETELLPVKGKPVFLFHPSLRYMLKRYGLEYLGSIEPSPGKEPSAKFIAGITERLKIAGAKAIFTEPQLPEAPAKTIAEAANVKLFELDPIGGFDGRTNYASLILYNSGILVKAFK